jgi:hypothetical protein
MKEGIKCFFFLFFFFFVLLIICGRYQDVVAQASELLLFKRIRDFNNDKSPFIEFIEVVEDEKKHISLPPADSVVLDLAPTSKPPPPPPPEDSLTPSLMSQLSPTQKADSPTFVTADSQNDKEKTRPEREKLVDFAYSLVLKKFHFEKPCSFFIHNHRLLSLLIGEFLTREENKNVNRKALLSKLFGHPDAALLVAQEAVVLWVVLSQNRINLWRKSSFPLDPFLKLYDGYTNGFLVLFM